MAKKLHVGDYVRVTSLVDDEIESLETWPGREGVISSINWDRPTPVSVRFNAEEIEAFWPEELEVIRYDVALDRLPEETLEDAYQYIARNRQRGPGRYDVADIAAMIILDQLQLTFNAYPFAGERSAS